MNLKSIFLLGVGAVLCLIGLFVIWGNPTAIVNLIAGIVLIIFGVAIILKKDITID